MDKNQKAVPSIHSGGSLHPALDGLDAHVEERYRHEEAKMEVMRTQQEVMQVQARFNKEEYGKDYNAAYAVNYWIGRNSSSAFDKHKPGTGRARHMAVPTSPRRRRQTGAASLAAQAPAAAAGRSEVRLHQKCDVMNCEIEFSSLAELIDHTEAHVHTPCHPARHLMDGQLTNDTLHHCCTTCGNLYKTADICQTHMEEAGHDHLQEPVPIAGWICLQCFLVFPSNGDCRIHQHKERHTHRLHGLPDDKGKLEPQFLPQPVYEEFLNTCKQVASTVECLNCNKALSDSVAATTHTLQGHQVMAFTDKTPADVWQSLMCKYTCIQCLRLYRHLPTGGLGALHTCSPTMVGMVVENDCKTTCEFLLRRSLKTIGTFAGAGSDPHSEATKRDVEGTLPPEAEVERGAEKTEHRREEGISSIVLNSEDYFPLELLTDWDGEDVMEDSVLVVNDSIDEIQDVINIVDSPDVVAGTTSQLSHRITRSQSRLSTASIELIESPARTVHSLSADLVKLSCEAKPDQSASSLLLEDPKPIGEICMAKKKSVSNMVTAAGRKGRKLPKDPKPNLPTSPPEDAGSFKVPDQGASKFFIDKDSTPVEEVCMRKKECMYNIFTAAKRRSDRLKNDPKPPPGQSGVSKVCTSTTKWNSKDLVDFDKLHFNPLLDSKCSGSTSIAAPAVMSFSATSAKFDLPPPHFHRRGGAKGKSKRYFPPVITKAERKKLLKEMKLKRPAPVLNELGTSAPIKKRKGEKTVFPQYASTEAVGSANGCNNISQGKRLRLSGDSLIISPKQKKINATNKKAKRKLLKAKRKVGKSPKQSPRATTSHIAAGGRPCPTAGPSTVSKKLKSPAFHLPGKGAFNLALQQRPVKKLTALSSAAGKPSPIVPGQAPSPPNVKDLENMVHIIFVDFDNWMGFWKRLLKPLPNFVFVWGFFGGGSNWKAPKFSQAYRQAVARGAFYLNPKMGKRKDATDFAICMWVGRMDTLLPEKIAFTILSGDKGFEELELQMTGSARRIRVINPHHTAPEEVYTLLLSMVGT